jgi:hypothetical protein
MTKPSKNDIASEVCSNRNVAPDGLDNRDRLAFIGEVFEVDVVALADTFDYDAAIASGDVLVIQASYFLAQLQHEFSTRCAMHGIISEMDHITQLNMLIVAKAKMRWALLHLQAGNEPTPYPFLN